MKKLVLTIAIVFLIPINAQTINNTSLDKLMPIPEKITKQKGIFKINKYFKVIIPDTDNKRVFIASKKFIRRLSDRTGIFLKNGFPQKKDNTIKENVVIVNYNRKGELKFYEDESYSLIITNNTINISANTDIGVIYAFETLLQLLDYTNNFYYFPNVIINDKPRFTWRGLMIDAARHFQPVEVIKRNLDAMLVAKLNTFHWHLSDNQGFRIEIKKYPELMQKGTDEDYYTQEQIKEIVQYASDRGIRVIPEIDIPGHATALLTAFPEIGSVKDTTYTLQRNAGIFDPTLNPVNPKTYKILDGIFEEMTHLFPFEYFHIGGDENEGKHWDKNKEIADFKKKLGFKNNHELQTYFNIKIQKILKKYRKKMMGWEEIKTKQLPKDIIIHCWRGKGESLAKAVSEGYYAVLSNGFYIDLMLPASEHYKTKFVSGKQPLSKNEQKRILGGEATMWSELVTPLTIDSRIWPRTLAIGERLWSYKTTTTNKMYDRMFYQSPYLEQLGITHLKNIDVILRNITENQEITSLKNLTNIYEPLKYYTRNKDGTEYQTFSPFTLFADACSADAKDAMVFNNSVNLYIKTNDEKAKHKIKSLLKQWKTDANKVILLKPNPKLLQLYPMLYSLSDITNDSLLLMNNKKISKKKLDNHLKNASKPYNDVSLQIIEALKKLIEFEIKK